MFQVVKEKTLGYDSFIQETKDRVQALMGEDYDVLIKKTIKNNSLERHSLLVLKKGRSIAPNIYLEAYYDSYLQGSKLEEIVDRLYCIYNHCAIPTIKENFLYDLDDIKQYIICRIINYEKNVEQLKKVPHIRFLDFAITYHCLIKNDDEIIGTLRLSNEHIKHWGIDIQELDFLAMENTQRLFSAVIRDMDELIREVLLENDEVSEDIIDIFRIDDKKEIVKMYVLSNKSGVNGANCLLYDNLIKNFAEAIGSDLIIIPSSVHEIILVPSCESIPINELNEIVKDINRNQVPYDEILSDHVYYFSRERNKIIM